MFKKFCGIVLSATMILSMVLTALPASAAATKSQADAASSFTFKGSMSKEVLRSYASRAITLQGFTIENNTVNPLFEEDLRMIQRIGAKYIGRSAFYSWGGNMSETQVENHYKVAEELATKAHQADPELILQAGVFEIAYRETVNCTKIPAYVFEAFGLPVENRNFRWDKIVFPAGTKNKNGADVGVGFWGNDASGVPDITQTETKLYFYWQITRYIDAGYEAFHMGQAEMMMLYRGNSVASHWKTLLDKARAYAKIHARRGVVLFDYHNAIDSKGIKVGNNLVFDIVGAGMCPNETVYKDGAYQCEVVKYQDCWLSWVGRSSGGRHPLGFDIEESFTIIEFDNYGGNGNPGVATYDAFYNWGYDDCTWFATQPEWYRNQFLKETAEYLSNTSDILDSSGKQQYFLQPVCRRCIGPQNAIETTYTPGEDYVQAFVVNYRKTEPGLDYQYKVKYDSSTQKYLTSYVFQITGYYRANRQSDGCPNGGNQEDTIREIFLGKDAPEDPELLKVVLPEKYMLKDSSEENTAGDQSGTEDNNQTGNQAGNQTGTSSKPSTVTTTSKPGTTTGSLGNVGSVDDAEDSISSDNTVSNMISDNSSDAATDSVTDNLQSEEGQPENEESTASELASGDSADITTGSAQPKTNVLPWIVGVVVVILVLGGGGCGFYFLYYKKKK